MFYNKNSLYLSVIYLITQSEGELCFHLIITPSAERQSRLARFLEILHMRLVYFAQTVHMIKVMRQWEVHTGLFSAHRAISEHKQEHATSSISSAFCSSPVQVVIHKVGFLTGLVQMCTDYVFVHRAALQGFTSNNIQWQQRKQRSLHIPEPRPSNQHEIQSLLQLHSRYTLRSSSQICLCVIL